MCKAGCLPRKELFETWEAATVISAAFGHKMVSLNQSHPHFHVDTPMVCRLLALRQWIEAVSKLGKQCSLGASLRHAPRRRPSFIVWKICRVVHYLHYCVIHLVIDPGLIY